MSICDSEESVEDIQYDIRELAYVDSVSNFVNDDIDKKPDSYMYLQQSMEEIINKHQLNVIKKVFNKVPNIYTVLDFSDLLTLTDSPEIIEFLYSEQFKIKDKCTLEIMYELIEDKIRDLAPDNPDMFIIQYHKTQVDSGIWINKIA